MTIDALAFERHFADHLAPVWAALPVELRGRFLAEETIGDHVARSGVEAELADGWAIRRSIPAPLADPGDGPVALVASYGDIKLGRRLGYRRFVFLEHGIGQSYAGDRRSAHHGSYSGGEDREDVVLFLVPNGNAAARWRAGYPGARVDIVGGPRVDSLPARELTGDPSPVVAFSSHWNCSLVAETRPAFHHFKAGIREVARRYPVIGHGHPRGADWLQREYRRLGVEWVPDFADVCRRADVYACDNSSTMFEFATTGRPVVVLNGPQYRRGVDHGLRFWAAADVGIQVDQPGDLLAAVEEALRDTAEAQARREDALDIVYGVRHGGASLAAASIAALLGERALVAA